MDLLLGSLPFLLATTAVVLLAAAVLVRMLLLAAIALAFAPRCKRRMLELIEVATPLVRKSGPIGVRRLHERIAVPPLMLLAMMPSTAKTARRILAILNS